MMRVLVIDDDEEIRELLNYMLTNAGYTVTEACNGLDGLVRLRTEGSDCVLLDINMPRMNGWEVCRRIKDDPRTAQIPVIVLTVRNVLKDQREIDAAQPDIFVSKPFDKRSLLQAIHLVTRKTPTTVPSDTN